MNGKGSLTKRADGNERRDDSISRGEIVCHEAPEVDGKDYETGALAGGPHEETDHQDGNVVRVLEVRQNCGASGCRDYEGDEGEEPSDRSRG